MSHTDHSHHAEHTEPHSQEKTASVHHTKAFSPPHPSYHDKMTIFTSFAENPSGVRFETQHTEEQVVIFMRQHFIVNVPWILATLLLIAAPFGIVPFILRFVVLPFELPAAYSLIGILFWYIAVFGYALMNFIRWYYNIYIVTTERIIDIDFVQLLYKKFSEARIDNIEDVTYTTGGFLATIFNFGNVFIQTAAETKQFEFLAIPKPASVVQTISSMINDE